MYFSSFAIGGFVPSAAVAGILLLVGLGAFFYLGIKGPTDYWRRVKKFNGYFGLFLTVLIQLSKLWI